VIDVTTERVKQAAAAAYVAAVVLFLMTRGPVCPL
jgi:hypothetical protein